MMRMGVLIETVDMRPGGVLMNVPAGQWHSLKSLESGTVLFEAKDGAWEPLGEGEIWKGMVNSEMLKVFGLFAFFVLQWGYKNYCFR